tara:strand:- start:1785 stop:1934 length:150 start_codon:yes stop_codon:yes gene_type:complete
MIKKKADGWWVTLKKNELRQYFQVGVDAIKMGPFKDKKRAKEIERDFKE